MAEREKPAFLLYVMENSSFIEAKKENRSLISADPFLEDVVKDNMEDFAKRFPRALGDNWQMEDLLRIREHARIHYINEEAASYVLDYLNGDVEEGEVDYDLIGYFFYEQIEQVCVPRILRKFKDAAKGLEREIAEAIIFKELIFLKGRSAKQLATMKLGGWY